MEPRRIHRSTGVIGRVRAILWATMLASLLGASAPNARLVCAQDHMGSVHDYLSTTPNFPEVHEFRPLGIVVMNGEGTLQSGHRFDGVEIVGVVSGSPGAAAGLKGRQERLQTLMNVGMITASIFFPPAMLGVALLGSTGIGESHEFIIAVDGVRTHDVIEFDEALNQAEAGEIVYLTIVSSGRRKQIQAELAGPWSSSSFFGSEPNS